MRECCCFFMVLFVGVPSSMAVAAEDVPPFVMSLFDGKSLDGWVIENDAEVDVVDGCLRLKGGNGWLRSHHQYRDFVLSLEWKALQAKEYDAGIYIRSAATGKPFPKPTYQVNLLEGKEGNIGTLPGAESKGLVNPQGEWNRFQIRVNGEKVSLNINGREAYSVDGVKQAQGYIGFQVEVPKGGQFLIRNIHLAEVGHTSLFNGTDLTGWEGGDGDAAACWAVVDGKIVCDGKKGPWLRTAKEYGDFNLRFDYIVSPGGNSGIYVHVPKDGNHHRENDTKPEAGFEVQVLDDAAPQYATLKDYQYCASVYDICGADPRNCRPAGEWNTLEINRTANQVTTIHNGKVVVNITVESHPLLALRKTEGFLGLQNHSTVVTFRNLRLGPALEYPLAVKP